MTTVSDGVCGEGGDTESPSPGVAVGAAVVGVGAALVGAGGRGVNVGAGVSPGANVAVAVGGADG